MPGPVSAGGVASTAHDAVAGVGSVLPTESVARTENVCEPSASPVARKGDGQAENEPASILHSNVAGPPIAVNAIESEVEAIVAGIDVEMLVSGGVASTVKAREAAALWFRTESSAVT